MPYRTTRRVGRLEGQGLSGPFVRFFRTSEPQSAVTAYVASLHLSGWGAGMFPTWLSNDRPGADTSDTARVVAWRYDRDTVGEASF